MAEEKAKTSSGNGLIRLVIMLISLLIGAGGVIYGLTARRTYDQTIINEKMIMEQKESIAIKEGIQDLDINNNKSEIAYIKKEQEKIFNTLDKMDGKLDRLLMDKNK